MKVRILLPKPGRARIKDEVGRMKSFETSSSFILPLSTFMLWDGVTGQHAAL
jgi:hypothetical protein